MTDSKDPGGTPFVESHNVSPHSFARNVVFGYLATLTSLLSGLLVTPVLYRKLGVDAFGVFGLVSGITGLALLADLGVGTASIRRVAAAMARHDRPTLWATVHATRRLFAVSGAFSLLALGAVAALMPQLFGVPANLHSDARLSMLLSAVGQSVAVALGTPTAIIVGAGRSDLLAKRSVAIGLSTAATECVVALLGGGVVGVCAVVGVSSVVTALVGLLVQRRLLGVAPKDAARGSHGVADLLREGLANFAISVAGTVAFLSDTIVLGAIAPLAAVAAYTVAAKLPALIRILTSKAIDLLQPTYSHVYAVRDQHRSDALFQTLAQSTKFSVAAAVGIGLAVCSCSGLLLHAWIGATPAHTGTVLILLMCATVLQMSGHAIYVLLTGIRQLNRLLMFSVVSAIANISLSIWLTHHLGARGPALASLICVLVGDLAVLPALVAPTIGVSRRRVLRELTFIPLMPALLPVGGVVLADVSTDTAPSLAIAAAAALAYFALFWLTLSKDDRGFARHMLRRGVHRAAPA